MNSIVVGLQWGDEGKGKVVQHLSKNHDWVVRFSGGPNAGHTIYYNGQKFVHHLIPSGTKDNKLFIARGTLVDLETLNDEIGSMEKVFPNVRNVLYISPWCRVITPIEKKLDVKIEELKGSNAVGTTKRGIGPTVANDAHRAGLRLFDFFGEEKLRRKLTTLALISKPLIGDINVDEILEYLLGRFEKIQDRVKEASPIGSVLFEATQAIMLDPMYGTYPYVTSTSCLPSSAPYFSGLFDKRPEVFGVFKAYTTRVGSGPFPTEVFGEESKKLRKAGGEFGSTTGRPRRCGWIDLPLLKYACDIANVDHLVMTKADVLNGFDKIGICQEYEGEVLPYDLESAKPKIEYVKGWKSLQDSAFEEFLFIIEKTLKRKVEYISFGPKEEDIRLS